MIFVQCSDYYYVYLYLYILKIAIFLSMRTHLGQELARRVVGFYEKHDCCRPAAIKHFVSEGVSRSTTYAILRRYLDTGRVDYSKNRGPKATSCSAANTKRIANCLAKNPRLTLAAMAGKCRMSITSVRKCLKLANIETHKRVVAPKYIKNQAVRCKEAAKMLLAKTMPKHGRKVIVMDDETYVYENPEENASQSFFRAEKGVTVPDNVMFKAKTKFAGKYLVWQAISQDGQVSPPLIMKGTLNGQTYEKECLRGILLPWLKANFNLNEILFWPDLATCHYTRGATELPQSESIECIKRDENAPNLPQARPIEKYWALCKRDYSKLPIKPKSLRSFRYQWSKISKNVIEKSGERLFANLREKLRLVRKHGPYGPLKNVNLQH